MICLLGGYLIEMVLSDQFKRANRASEIYNQSALWEKDFIRVVDDISLFLVTVDLILGSDATYLLSSDGKLIFPNDFLPIAERYYLGARLDRWIINSVIDWLVSHPLEMEQLEACAINLSGQSVGSKELLEFVVAKLNETNFPASKLCFEVTETAAITDLDKAYQFIAQLKAAGCRFALDDFGSGLSLFAYLLVKPMRIFSAGTLLGITPGISHLTLFLQFVVATSLSAIYLCGQH